MDKNKQDILWFKDINKTDIPLVGGKGANMGEMFAFGLPVPNGFAITSKAYFDFIKENKFDQKIRDYLAKLDINNPQSINEASVKIKKLIVSGKMNPVLSKNIIHSYLKLGKLFKQALVAIRSSATAEDLPTASFAGQQRTFLNIQGEANVVESVKECWASLFEARAIFYRQEKKFAHFKVGLCVLIQEMIPADISGVMFTVDPVTNQKNRIIIEAVYGLGEYIVQGEVSPDHYVVDKQNFNIINRQIEKQTIQLIKKGSLNKKVPVPKNKQLRRKLTDQQIIELSKLGQKIHHHYFFPQDIEWVIYKNKFFIVQTRPVTTLNTKSQILNPKQDTIKRKIIMKGTGASPGIGTGVVCLIKSAKELNKIKNGDILVTPMTSPDFVPAMKKVHGIVTDHGGQTSHAAIVSRELGIPCIVGTENATKILKNEQIITVNGSSGDIYKGGILKQNTKSQILNSNEIQKLNIQIQNIKTATKVYVNLAEPERAQEISKMNVDGVGLLRAEFILAQIGIHPKKFIHDKTETIFIKKLADNIEKFCQPFFPRPVIYRTSDFKTNEYRSLIGGKAYEEEENNPFIGFRGTSRYLADPAVFEMELTALKKVKKRYHNLSIMIPFCRTPDEYRKVKKIIYATGLERTPNFKIWLMVEIPSNVILLDEFIKIGLDGVSIGSNDLTMLLLGIDRDNENIASLFNEKDASVLWALEKTVKTCLKNKITCSICGQAPSNDSQLVEKLVQWGITSISVNPDAVNRVRQLIYQTENGQD